MVPLYYMSLCYSSIHNIRDIECTMDYTNGNAYASEYLVKYKRQGQGVSRTHLLIYST